MHLVPTLALAAVLAATACSADATVAPDSAAPDAAAASQEVTLRFDARVGDRPFSCAETFALGTPPVDAVVRDVRSYVYDVRLIDETGARAPLVLAVDGIWQNERVALLDFETGRDNCRNGTAETNAVIRGTAPAGTYRGVEFSIGVPLDLNHTDPSLASSPLTLSTLQWTWNFGYIFLRVDAELASAAGMEVSDGGMSMGAPGAYLMHLGSAGCSGEASAGQPVTCSRANRGEVLLEGFDPLAEPIVFDVGALFAGSNLAAPDQGGSPGCMSSPDDPECAVLLERVGVDADTGAPRPAGQRAFRAP